MACFFFKIIFELTFCQFTNGQTDLIFYLCSATYSEMCLLFCFRLPEEEAGGLCAHSGGTGEDPEDGTAFRSNQSQVEGGSGHQRPGHHLPGRSLRVYCRLAGAPAGTHQRGQVGPQDGSK